MQRRAVLAEQPAELGERLEVAAVGESRDAEGTPGAGGDQPAFGRIDGRERPGRMPAGRGGVGAQGRTVAVMTSADAATISIWVVSPRPAASEATSRASSQRPVSMYAHPSTVRLPPLVPRTPGARSRSIASCSKRDRQVGFVQEPCGGRYSPQGGLFNRRVGDLAQVREELVSAADRVGAGPYPESQHVDINARGLAGGGGPWRSSRPRARLTAWRLAAFRTGRRQWRHSRARPRRGPAGHATPLRRRR